MKLSVVYLPVCAEVIHPPPGTLMSYKTPQQVGPMDGGQNEGGEDFEDGHKEGGQDLEEGLTGLTRTSSASSNTSGGGGHLLVGGGRGQVVFVRKHRKVTTLKGGALKSSAAGLAAARARKAGGAEPRALTQYYTPMDEADATLVFESRFESGNLYQATKVGEFEYNLQLCADWNTTSHVQWFYFSVSNTRAGVRYRFNIENMVMSLCHVITMCLSVCLCV